MKIKKRFKALLIGVGCCILTATGVSAKSAVPYDRSSFVAPEEYTSSAMPEVRANNNSRAWQKINGVCYNGSGVRIDGAITRGIDISEWQTYVNWAKVAKSNVDFAFIRVSYGLNHIDKYYDANMRGANAANLPVGVYLYSTATTTEGALREAQLTINKMKGYKISYPVVYDLEYSEMERLSPTEISKLAVTFCEEIKKAGYYPMVYMNANWYKNVVNHDLLKDYDCWLAIYGDKINAPSHTAYDYTIWQATDGYSGGLMKPTKGLIDGLDPDDNVDVSFGFVDYTKKITPRTQPRSDYVPTPIKKNGWVTENGQTYYYVDDVKLRGRQKIGSKYYRLDSKDGHLYRSTILFSAKTLHTVYVDANGAEVSSRWVTHKNKTYYIGTDHLAYRGSRNVGGKFYFFNSRYGYIMKNWKFVSTKKDICYYDAQGVRFQGGFKTLTENGKKNTYYFSTKGIAYTGWHTIKGKLYYFYGKNTSKNAVRAENVTLVIDNYRCVFDKNGVCVRRTRIS